MMRSSTTLILLAAVLLAAGNVSAGEVADRGGDLPPEPFADSWFLVRLADALDGLGPDGSFPLVTGRPALDARIVEAGIHRIEHALRVSMRAPKDPEGLARLGLDRTYRFHVPYGSDIPALVERFAATAGVVYAEPDYIGRGGATMPNDPRFGDQWNLENTGQIGGTPDADVDATLGWDVSVGGSEQIIAVLDTGIDSDHEEFVGKQVPGFDFVNNDSNPEDDHGHGSNVASIAAANTDNGLGIAGACWNCRIMPLKVLDSNNSGVYSDWADAMVWATDNGARVINLSGGGFSHTPTLLDGVQYAYWAGVIHVSITQNQDTNTIYYPGKYPETIAVGGTDEFDDRADPFCFSATSGSNFGLEIDVVAPGDWIWGAAWGGGYDRWCGTSQAAPLVAGLVANMRTIYPSIGREEARHLLHSGAEDQVGRPAEDTAGFDIYHGWGRVNMDRTLRGTEASITLRVEGKTATRVYYETANPLADSYDFVRGDLGALSEDVARVDLGTLVCLENDSLDPDTAGDEDTGTPDPSTGYFYLGRFNSAPEAGSYGGSSRNRDRSEASPGDCSRF